MRTTGIAAIVLGLAIIFLPAAGGFADAREEIMEADRAFDRATAAKGVDGWVPTFTGDARMFAAGEIQEGHAAIRKLMTPTLQKGNSLRWKPVYAEVGRSADLGYTIGESKFRGAGPDGKLVERDGRYVTIWRRQKDGTWKVALDIGTSSPPRPVAQ